jgi:hypothetical protein
MVSVPVRNVQNAAARQLTHEHPGSIESTLETLFEPSEIVVRSNYHG